MEPDQTPVTSSMSTNQSTTINASIAARSFPVAMNAGREEDSARWPQPVAQSVLGQGRQICVGFHHEQHSQQDFLSLPCYTWQIFRSFGARHLETIKIQDIAGDRPKNETCECDALTRRTRSHMYVARIAAAFSTTARQRCINPDSEHALHPSSPQS